MRGISVSRDDAAVAFYASDGSVPDELYAAARSPQPHAPDERAQPEHPPRGPGRADGRAIQVLRQRLRFPGVLYKPHQASAAAKAPGAGTGSRRPGRPGAGRLLRAHAGAGQPRLRRVRHQQPRQLRLRQDLLRDGRPEARRSRPGRRRREQADARRHRIRGPGAGSASSAAATAATWCSPRSRCSRTRSRSASICSASRTGCGRSTSIPPWWGSFSDALYAEMGDPKTDARTTAPHLAALQRGQDQGAVDGAAGRERSARAQGRVATRSSRRRKRMASRSSTSSFPTRGTGS